MALLFLGGCRPEQIHVEDNPIPPYDGVPTVILDAYLTRIYIDLIGREPLESELQSERQALRDGNLEPPARLNLVNRLMGQDPTHIAASDLKLANDLSARFLNGISQEAMWDEVAQLRNLASQDSLQGNQAGYLYFSELANRMEGVTTAVQELRVHAIDWREVCRRHCFNTLYDDLNMNSFNFINAAFDDLFGREPTEAEFEQAYTAVEFNGQGVLFGAPISSKEECLATMVANAEFDEGAMRWWGSLLLVRPITTAEINSWKSSMGPTVDIRALQRLIMTGDEYADF